MRLLGTALAGIVAVGAFAETAPAERLFLLEAKPAKRRGGRISTSFDVAPGEAMKDLRDDAFTVRIDDESVTVAPGTRGLRVDKTHRRVRYTVPRRSRGRGASLSDARTRQR